MKNRNEGGLDLPQRNSVNWEKEEYWEEDKLDQETRRQFEPFGSSLHPFCRQCQGQPRQIPRKQAPLGHQPRESVSTEFLFSIVVSKIA